MYKIHSFLNLTLRHHMRFVNTLTVLLHCQIDKVMKIIMLSILMNGFLISFAVGGSQAYYLLF